VAAEGITGCDILDRGPPLANVSSWLDMASNCDEIIISAWAEASGGDGWSMP